MIGTAKQSFAIYTLMLFLACNVYAQVPSKVILDTDISSDADDVGAVALLHNMADTRPVEILAMMVSSGDPWSGRCLHVINSYFNRPDIPIGLVSGESVRHDSLYTRAIAELGDYLLPGSEEDAVTLYRKVLAQQPDFSVTIVTIGYLTNLKDLLASKPDAYSELSGQDLVRLKVKRLICMGGQYPRGKEWNFYQDKESTGQVLTRWPTAIYFVGYEMGKDVITGSGLKMLEENNPVRLSYDLHNGLEGRPSWDQLTVLYAVIERDESRRYFSVSSPGRNTIDSSGINTWQKNAGGNHRFLQLKISQNAVSQLIEGLMTGEQDLPF